MSKNIVVFSDGTGQEGGEGNNSNIYKLFNMVEDRSSRQIVFYDRGLGTGWRKITGNVAGMGISKNILECYEFIFENYSAGDDIYLFGFSRGATTVKSLSSFIHLFGILPKSRKSLIKKAYKIYKIKNKDKRNTEANKFVIKHHTMWCRIKFIGVWDTVAALGIPNKSIDLIVDKIPFFRHKFQDLSLSFSVEKAYHALAIDDERLTFHPTLWRNNNLKDYQTVNQVWFCGMHTDVGGGYAHPELSDITLEWMLQKATNQGLKIYNKLALNPDPDGFMENSRGGKLSQFFRQQERFWPKDRTDKPVVHWSVAKRKKNKQNLDNPAYSPWILKEDYIVEMPNGSLIDGKSYNVAVDV